MASCKATLSLTDILSHSSIIHIPPSLNGKLPAATVNASPTLITAAVKPAAEAALPVVIIDFNGN